MPLLCYTRECVTGVTAVTHFFVNQLKINYLIKTRVTVCNNLSVRKFTYKIVVSY